MRKATKNKRPPVDRRTADEIQLSDDRRRLARRVRDQRAITALARQLRNAIVASDYALTTLASSIADKQGYHIIPRSESEADRREPSKV